ncbi:MAG: hypothetical protein ACW99J_19550, partial [Candidatus Thorarchaeota archaeon]
MSYYKTPLKYGSVVVDEFLPSSLENVSVLKVAEFIPDFTEFEKKLGEVLDSPLGSKPFDQIVGETYEPGRTIMIIVDDNTRP